jgi:hypothetical protein
VSFDGRVVMRVVEADVPPCFRRLYFWSMVKSIILVPDEDKVGATLCQCGRRRKSKDFS